MYSDVSFKSFRFVIMRNDSSLVKGYCFEICIRVLLVIWHSSEGC